MHKAETDEVALPRGIGRSSRGCNGAEDEIGCS